MPNGHWKDYHWPRRRLTKIASDISSLSIPRPGCERGQAELGQDNVVN